MKNGSGGKVGRETTLVVEVLRPSEMLRNVARIVIETDRRCAIQQLTPRCRSPRSGSRWEKFRNLFNTPHRRFSFHCEAIRVYDVYPCRAVSEHEQTSDDLEFSSRLDTHIC